MNGRSKLPLFKRIGFICHHLAGLEPTGKGVRLEQLNQICLSTDRIQRGDGLINRSIESCVINSNVVLNK